MILTSRRAALTTFLFACSSFDVFAADHFMVIQEVFPGTSADPAAQYVMLRMTANGQNLVSADFVEVQDASGTVLGRFGTFPGNVATGTPGCAYPNCPAILIGTAAAQTLLGFTFDTVVDAQAGRVPLPLSGGRVCYRTGTTATFIADCIAYGNFTGANTIATPTTNGCDANFGTPAVALAPGFALTRKLFNCAAKENSTDFENRFPHPVSNSGGNANTDSDADGLINILDCDDTNGNVGLYPPIGVADLSVNGGLVANWTWTPEPAPVGTSLVYDLTQMLLTDLTTQPTCDSAGAAGVPAGAGVTGTSVQESLQPALGEIYYYAVRSRTICGSAPYC